MPIFLMLAVLWCGSLLAQSEQGLQKAIFSARDQVLPALVHIEPVVKIFSRGEEQKTVVTGSGVIFSDQGFVLTNHHVADNAEKVWCTLSNRERITATVVGSDPSTDIAVLKLNLSELKDPKVPHARLGNSAALEVGQIVLALGSPLGLSRSVSMGVVSSIDRYFPDRGEMVSPYNLWIQTDAAINPGNSGGPLINLDGDVVGINARAVFFAENLGFAIPINLVREVAEEIIRGSSVKRAWLGVEFKDIKDLRAYLDDPDFAGVLVSNVERLSPAEKAGIQVGDVLLQIDGGELNAPFEEDLPGVRKVVAGLPVDQSLPFAYWRDGKRYQSRVTPITEPFTDETEVEIPDLGVVVQNLSLGIFRMQQLDSYQGVYVSSIKPGSRGEEGNFRRGDVVVTVNGENINSAESLKEKLSGALKSDKPVFLELRRRGYPYFSVIYPDSES